MKNAENINRQGGENMQKQTVEFATKTVNGVVQTIGKSYILQPKTNYNGKSTKWLTDKPKQQKSN